MNGFVELPPDPPLSDIDSEAVCGSMPSDFARAAENAKTEPTTGENVNGPCHLLERCFYLGNGNGRIFCFVAYVQREKSYHWCAIIAAPIAGNVNNPLTPVSKWKVEQHTSALQFRDQFRNLAGEYRESCDGGDTIILRGATTQG